MLVYCRPCVYIYMYKVYYMCVCVCLLFVCVFDTFPVRLSEITHIYAIGLVVIICKQKKNVCMVTLDN